MANILIESPIAMGEAAAETCGVSPINPANSDAVGLLTYVVANPLSRAYFEYREKGNLEWIRSEFQINIEDTNDFERVIESLDSDTEYEFRAAFGKDSPTYYGSIEELKTLFLHTLNVDTNAEAISPTTNVEVKIFVPQGTTTSASVIPIIIIKHNAYVQPEIAAADSNAVTVSISINVSHIYVNAPILNNDTEGIIPVIYILRSEWITGVPPPSSDSEGIAPTLDTVTPQNIIAPFAESASIGKEDIFIVPYTGVLSYIQYKKLGEEVWLSTDSIVIDESGSFYFIAEDLDRNITYEFRAVGNQDSDVFGSTLTFTTPLVLVDDVSNSLSEGLVPFIPVHCYTYPQPADSESSGISSEIYTEYPFSIDIPIADTSIGQALSPEYTSILGLRLTRIGEGVIRLEWKHEMIWAGIVSHLIEWNNRNLEISLFYRRELHSNIESVSKEQFRLFAPTGVETTPDVLNIDVDAHKLKLVFNDFYTYMHETVHDQYLAVSSSNGIAPNIKPMPEIVDNPFVVESEANGLTPIISAPYKLMFNYVQSTNENLRLKDFYGDDVDSPENIIILVPIESYLLTFKVNLEV